MFRSVQCQELEDSLREAQQKTSSTVAELRQASTYTGRKLEHVKALRWHLPFCFCCVLAYLLRVASSVLCVLMCHTAQLDTDSLSAPNLGLAV